MEMRVVDLLSRGHGHRRMVECPAEVDRFAAGALESDERIVGGHLRIITVPVRLRQPVQLSPAKPIRLSMAQYFRHVGDVRAPVRVWRSARCVYLQVRRAVGVQHLASGQQQQAAIVRQRVRSVAWSRHGIQSRAVELKETDGEPRPAGIDTCLSPKQRPTLKSAACAKACNIVTGVKLSTTRVLARHSPPSELTSRKNQATSSPDWKSKDCSTNCPELC
jgi:hypothetical protein